MARRALVEILGNADGFRRATHQSITAANQLGRGLKNLSVDANASARQQIAASERKTARLRKEIVAYREIASSARRGSHEQVAAAQLASQAERRLARSLGVTAREQRTLTASARSAERGLVRGTRGALAGSGAFRSMGRSIAFASGAFIGVAGVAQFLRSSIDAGVEAAATEKQLAAQFRQSGLSLGKYKGEIEDTTARLSSLSGFTRDDLTKTFTTAFRATQNVQKGLKLTAVAADAARGAHKPLNVVTLALTKAILGQTGGLRRLGIIVPKTAHGMEVLRFVGERFAGQARAGTTAQQRFSAELHNSQVIIGTALLPVLTRLLSRGAHWLSQMNRSGRLQRNVNAAVRTGGQIFHGFVAVVRPLANAMIRLSHALGGAKNTAKLFASVFIGMKVLKWAAEFRALAASIRAVGFAEIFAGGGAKGIKGIPIAGGLGGAAVGGIAGAVLALGQRGETGTKPSGAMDVSVGPGGIVTYKDPVTGKYVMVGGFKGGDKDAFVARDIRKRHPELARPQGTGEDVAIRGAGARQQTRAETARGRDPDRRHRRRQSQFALLELQLAQAQLTTGTADDRRILVQEAANIRNQIARGHHSLQERTQLYQQLAGVEDQIRGIDKTNADSEKAARDKRLALKKKQAEQEKQHMQKLQERFKADKQAMQQAIDTARGQIGDLFQGPVLNPTEEQRKRALGVPGVSATALVRDIRGQTQEFNRWQRDLKRIQRRGGRPLRRELEALGPGAEEEVHALAGASPRVLNQFLRAYRQRERAVRQAARDAAPKVFVNVTLDGKKIAEAVTIRQERAKRQVAHSRRGR